MGNSISFPFPRVLANLIEEYIESKQLILRSDFQCWLWDFLIEFVFKKCTCGSFETIHMYHGRGEHFREEVQCQFGSSCIRKHFDAKCSCCHPRLRFGKSTYAQPTINLFSYLIYFNCYASVFEDTTNIDSYTLFHGKHFRK